MAFFFIMVNLLFCFRNKDDCESTHVRYDKQPIKVYSYISAVPYKNNNQKNYIHEYISLFPIRCTNDAGRLVMLSSG